MRPQIRIILQNNHYLLMLLFCLTSSLFAQPAIQWTKTFGGFYAEGVYSPNCIEQTSDNGYIIAAGSGSTDGDVIPVAFGFGDYWIVKLDSLGNITWQKKYGGSQGEAVMAVKQSIFGGYYVAGYSQSTDGFINSNHGLFDVWILKLNSVGDTIWSKTYGGSSEDRASSIQETSDGRIIFAGYTLSNNGDVSGNHGDWDYWAAMIDSTGNLLWQKTYGGTQEEQANSIEKTIDGGFILSGYTESNDGDVTNFIGNSDAWVVKIDSIGNIQWQKCLGGTLIDKGYKAIQTTSGDYILSCMSFSNNTFVHDHISAFDSWVVKLDPLGDTIWTKSYGGNGDDFGMDIQQTSSGGFILGSSSNSTSTGVSGNHGMSDYWACKIDPTGSVEWENSYGGNSIEYFQALRQTTDGGFILIGQTLSSANGDVSINKGSYDLFVVKLNNENGLSVNNQELNVRVLVFPNPAIDKISVESESKQSQLILYNVIGEVVLSIKAVSNKTDIDLSKETNGVYFMKITTEKGSITKRIVKQ